MPYCQSLELRRCTARSIASSSTPQPDHDSPHTNSIWGISARVSGQTMQAVVANGALILWPALLIPGSLSDHRIWLLFMAYNVFFAVGTLHRLLKHGPPPPTPRVKDVKSKLSLIAFILSIPSLHWFSVLFYLRDTAPQSPLFRFYKGSVLSSEGAICLDLIGSTLIILAIALNFNAAKLVHIRHPIYSSYTPTPYIYSSYTLLFVGFALSLHSIPFAALLLLVCLLYYKHRTWIEGGGG